MREPAESRRQRILAAVRTRGSVRITDLAAELDVSVITVRRDVEELAQAGALRRGHGTARALTAGAPTPPPAAPERGAIALVVPERHAYLHETMTGARKALEAAGMRVVLHIAPQTPGAERQIVDRLLAQDIQGLLLAPRWRTTQAELSDDWLAGIEVPVVLMERRPWPGTRLHAVDSVCTDHWYGMHLAVEHLVSLGHRRILLAARDDSPTARSLRAAFAEIASYRAEIRGWGILLSARDAGARAEGETQGAGSAEAGARSAGSADVPGPVPRPGSAGLPGSVTSPDPVTFPGPLTSPGSSGPAPRPRPADPLAAADRAGDPEPGGQARAGSAGQAGAAAVPGMAGVSAGTGAIPVARMTAQVTARIAAERRPEGSRAAEPLSAEPLPADLRTADPRAADASSQPAGPRTACHGDAEDPAATPEGDVPAPSAGAASAAADAGAAGSAGVAGVAGSAGAAGSAEDAGIVGSAGSAGAAGSTGSAGVAGAAGTAGLAGTAGPSGASGTAAAASVAEAAATAAEATAAPAAVTEPLAAAPEALAAALREHRATAVILHGDVDALILVQQLAESGIHVPQHCSVVAYDDVVAALGSPPLTAVAPPKTEVGRVAAELLLTRLASAEHWHPRRVELLPELMVRGSAVSLIV